MRCAFLLALAATLLAAQFRTTSTLVIAPATITDAAGKYIDGLTPQDLILYDNNVPQPIQVEEAFNPLSLIVVIQTSSNSSANLDKLSDSGILFTHLVAGDRGQTSLVSFSDTTEVLTDFTANPDRLASALRRLHTQGNGSIALDAVMDALTMLNKRPAGHRRVLLVIGEARDRSSRMHLQELSAAALRQNVLIYWLAYSPFASEFTARPKTVQSLDPKKNGEPIPRQVAPGSFLSIFREIEQRTKADAAQELTRATGGRMVHYVRKEGLEEAIQSIGAEIHRQYLVSFQPRPAPPGQYHSIRIAVKDRPELTARTRAGYWTVQ